MKPYLGVVPGGTPWHLPVTQRKRGRKGQETESGLNPTAPPPVPFIHRVVYPAIYHCLSRRMPCSAPHHGYLMSVSASVCPTIHSKSFMSVQCRPLYLLPWLQWLALTLPSQSTQWPLRLRPIYKYTLYAYLIEKQVCSSPFEIQERNAIVNFSLWFDIEWK